MNVRKYSIILILILTFCSFPIQSDPVGDPQKITPDILPGGDLLLLHQESTIFGGSLGEYGDLILVDDDNTIYLIGRTESDDFPLVNALLGTKSGSIPFITAFDTDKSIIYSTFLGGSGTDYIYSATFDDQGNLVVVGYTSSSDFPVTSDALNSTFASSAAFISKISPNGTLLYSSFFGGSGSDAFYDIVYDDAIYLAGFTASTDYPITDNAFSGDQGGYDIVFTVLDKTDNTVQYSTYIGGGNEDRGNYIAKEGNEVVIAGVSDSSDFPEINDTGYKVDAPDIVLVKFDLSKMNITFSSYFGSDFFQSVDGLAINNGRIYLAGWTEYEIYGLNSPLISWSYYDGYILGINSTSMEIDSGTYIGGSDIDEILSLDLTDGGDIIFTGTTSSSDFPTFGLLEDTILNTDVGTEIFIGIMSPDLTRVRYLDAFGYMNTERSFGITTKDDMLYMIGSAFLDDIIEPTFELAPGGGIIDVFYTAAGIGSVYPEFDDLAEIKYTRSNQQYTFSSTGPHRILNASFEWLLEPGKNGTLIDSSLTTPVGEGYHYLKMYPLLDFNQIITNYATFYIDDTSPIVQLLTVTNGSDVEINSPLQFLVVDDTLDQVTYSLNGGSSITLYEPYTITMPSQIGSLDIEIHAIDRAGNEANKHYTFTIVEAIPVSTPTVTEYLTETVQETNTVTTTITDIGTTTVTSTLNPSSSDTSTTQQTYLHLTLFLPLLAIPVVIRRRLRR